MGVQFFKEWITLHPPPPPQAPTPLFLPSIIFMTRRAQHEEECREAKLEATKENEDEKNERKKKERGERKMETKEEDEKLEEEQN